MDKKYIKELVHKIGHELVSDMSCFVWEIKDKAEASNELAYINGVTGFVSQIIKELDKTESDCNEDN